MLRILVNSPDEAVARALEDGLDPEVFLVTDVRPGPGFVRSVRGECSDIVIIDRVNERLDAAQVEIEVVKGFRPEARVIVISEESSEKDAKIIEQGVYYYLTSGTVSELIRVVKAAAQSLGVHQKETGP
jgi:DNA-binding NtrC family response regulator